MVDISGMWKSFFILLIAVQICMIPFYQTMTGHSYAHLRRIHHLINTEFLMFIGSLVIWKRLNGLVQSVTTSSLVHDISKLILVIFLLCCHLCCTLYYFLLGEEPHPFAVFCFTCLAFFVYLSSLLFIAVTGNWFVKQLMRISPGKKLLGGLYRVPLLKPLLTVTYTQTVLALLLSTGCTYIGYQWAVKGPQIHSITIPLQRLPPALHGLRIALLSDIHIGPTVGKKRVEEAVRITNLIEPDIITIVGDLVDGSLETYIDVAAPLRNLKSKRGIFFVTGNHEYYHGNIDKWFSHLRSIGITVLHNNNVQIELSDSNDLSNKLCLAGVDDHHAENSGIRGHHLDITAALDGCSDQKQPVLLLCHQPRGVRRVLETIESVKKRKIDLILAGHTHGGQLWVIAPFARLTNPFFKGLYELATGTKVYVSAGVYFWGAPVKNTGLEITNITLTKT